MSETIELSAKSVLAGEPVKPVFPKVTGADNNRALQSYQKALASFPAARKAYKEKTMKALKEKTDPAFWLIFVEQLNGERTGKPCAKDTQASSWISLVCADFRKEFPGKQIKPVKGANGRTITGYILDSTFSEEVESLVGALSGFAKRFPVLFAVTDPQAIKNAVQDAEKLSEELEKRRGQIARTAGLIDKAKVVLGELNATAATFTSWSAKLPKELQAKIASANDELENLDKEWKELHTFPEQMTAGGYKE